MRLVSGDGAMVELRVVGYQFANMTDSPKRDWDANWLRVAGSFRTSDGRTWSSIDACLTTWEARELGSWFREVLSGAVSPAPFDGTEDEELVVFTEPNVAISLAARDGDVVTVRVHLSLESRPPWLHGDSGGELFEYFVAVSTSLSALTDATDTWEQELEAFPVR